MRPIGDRTDWDDWARGPANRATAAAFQRARNRRGAAEARRRLARIPADA